MNNFQSLFYIEIQLFIFFLPYFFLLVVRVVKYRDREGEKKERLQFFFFFWRIFTVSKRAYLSSSIYPSLYLHPVSLYPPHYISLPPFLTILTCLSACVWCTCSNLERRGWEIWCMRWRQPSERGVGYTGIDWGVVCRSRCTSTRPRWWWGRSQPCASPVGDSGREK